MAADDKGTGSESPLHVAHGATPPAEHGPQSEWTVSDRRGPLDSADDDGIERVVPAHEIDAEGGLDSHPPIEAAAPAGQEARPEPAPATASADPARANASADPAPAGPNAAPRRSLLPVAAGLVVGALVGAGSAWLVYAGNAGSGDNDKQVAALATRVDALDKRPDAGPELATLRDDVAAVRGKVAALEKAGAGAKPGPAASGASDAALAAKVAALQAALAALQAKATAPAPTAVSTGTIDALRATADAARKQAGEAEAAANAVKAEQQQVGAKLAALNGAVSGTLAKAEGAQKKAGEARSGLDAVQTRQTALEAKLGSPALAVVADSLLDQIRTGQPFQRQVDALSALKVDPATVAVLREKAGGVASAQTLSAEWKPLENAVIATGNKAPADAGFGQRLERGLFGLVSVRRADGTVGDSLAARVSAIEADLANGDVAGAAAAWQALPADAKARSEAWGAKLGASASTLATARHLQRDAIDALGGKQP